MPLKTIDELIDALESGDYQKGAGQFKVVETITDTKGVVTEKSSAFCCLGVYATISTIPFSKEQAVFQWPGGPMEAKASLPSDHWLLTKIHITEGAWVNAGYDVQLQSYLTDINDYFDEEKQGTVPDFRYVVRALKEFREGRRSFPASEVYIKEEAEVA